MTSESGITSRVEEALNHYVQPERRRLAQLLAGSPAPVELEACLCRLTEAAACSLAVARASVWLVCDGGRAIECVDLYEAATGRHSRGAKLDAAATPRYFEALAAETAIAAHDARADPRTSEFTASYLDPLGITSMLDAPIFAGGRMVGVFCHEQVGPRRRWQAWEELVAGTFADFVAQVLEADRRRGPAAAPELEQSLESLLDASPIPLLLTRAADHRTVYANARALAFFEVKPKALAEQDTAAFWVSEQERQAFLERVLRDGRVEDFAATLCSAGGRHYSARVSAQAVKFRGELALLAGVVDVTDRRRAEDNLQTVFANAPVALVLSRLDDQVLLDGNRHAAALFDLAVDEAKGRQAPDFWVHPEDRDRLRDEVRAKRTIDGFVAELKSATGRRFWAELSACVVDYGGTPALLVGGHDITTRRRAEQALKEREDGLRTLLDSAPLPLVVKRLSDGLTRYANQRAADLFGYPLSDLVGQHTPDLYVDPAARQAFVDALERDGKVSSHSAQLKTRSGRAFWVLMDAQTMEVAGERVVMVGFTEVTALKELEQRLWTMATTDWLTGVFNRRHFFELAEPELARATRYGHPVSVAMVDIDDFKRINDAFGHQAGDVAVRAIAQALRGQLRDADVVARYGGEEFIALFPETALEAAQATAERLRKTIADGLPEAATWKRRPITVSIGVAQRLGAESLDEVLRRADAAMYEAKAAGRDRVVLAR